MAAIDIEKLLAEVSPDLPAGEDLEYDPAFGALERSAQGKPEQQFGDTIIPAEDPDWRTVKNNALELFPRTKDLRVAMYLVQALIRTDGVPGLNDGLAVLRGLLERFWETVHPQLDPDDDNDPTMRVNILVTLCDSGTTLRGVREAPLVAHRAFGRFSLRDIQVAAGLIAVPMGQNAPDGGAIDAAFMEIDLAELQATADAVQEATAAVRSIEDFVTRTVGASQAPDLSDLRDLLKEAGQALSERLTRRGVFSAGGEEEAEMVAVGSPGSAGAPQRIAGEVASRQDVIRVLDKACEYFARNEPTSPVPLLLERAKRLIGLNFLEILRDLAPDGLHQARNVAGITEE